ncbi:MAG TPA: dephospho-CoA kinase [Rhodanobacteraceae bacterium]|nr:dephospho-CoA kinase [Rhodanobacteraceae bacterium]
MTAQPPFVVALTGGVASGKSMVAQRFAALGVHVHDADAAARAVVEAGTPGLAAVVAAFGDGVLLADGALDRRAMRARVFAEADARHRLEAIVHPLVNDWLRARVAGERGPYALLAIPLLTETWPQYAWVDRVLAVDAPEALRIERLMRRDGIDQAAAERMLAAQAGREQRLARADDIIDNSGDPAALDAAVGALHARYLALAVKARTR